MNDVGLDREIVIDKVGWKRFVGVDAADLCRSKDQGIRLILRHPGVNGMLIA